MKKTLTIIFALCLTIATSSYAQNSASQLVAVNEGQKISTTSASPSTDDIIDTALSIRAEDHRSSPMFGFKAGINSACIYNDVAGFKAQPVVGWVAGAFLTLPISNLFGFQPEFLYDQKGFKSGGAYSGSDFSFERKSIYLDMPLLFQVKPGKCVSVVAGPVLSFLIHSKDTFGDGSATSEQETAITNGPMNKNILGAEGGIDIYIQRMVASLRGGLDLHQLGNNVTPGPRPYENYWVQVTLGYNLF